MRGIGSFMPWAVNRAPQVSRGTACTDTGVPRETWGALFTAQGMKEPMPRIQMLDGFNEGWIDFEGPRDSILKGQVTLADVVRGLIAL